MTNNDDRHIRGTPAPVMGGEEKVKKEAAGP